MMIPHPVKSHTTTDILLPTPVHIERIAASLDRSEPFPAAALRVSRAKGSRTQRVTLPEGWLAARDDDTPAPDAGEELEAALQAG